MKRIIDFCIALMTLFILMPIIALLFLVIKVYDQGPFLHWSERVGQNNINFQMPKIRTMSINAPQIATHLMNHPDQYITKIGKILRNYSLDEIPQLICLLNGKMSLIGPRPALFNQEDLVNLRTENGIHLMKPGLTGWAQVNGRDAISIKKKVDLEIFYKEKRNILLDIKIIYLTFRKVLTNENVTH